MNYIIHFKKAFHLFTLLFVISLFPFTASAQVEILLNGSAETNNFDSFDGGTIDHWTEESGTGHANDWGAYPPDGSLTNLNFNAQDGDDIFIPWSVDNSSDSNIWVLFQTVDVTSDATAIDNGNVTIDFSGYIQVANGSGDLLRIRVQFLDSGDSEIQAYNSGFINNEGSWQNLTDSRTAPNGTRSIKVILEADNSGNDTGDGTDNFVDGGFDNLSLIKTAPVTNAPPTTADADVFTVVSTEVVFSDSDFPFSDTDGDNLQQIDIKTLPAGGTLYLDGQGNVSVNDVIPVADLQAGNLRYTPPTDVTGYRAQNFTFRVNDGTDYSSSASTMYITMDAISVEIGDDGDDGENSWHLISNPTNSNLTDLLSNVWTQGATNAKYTGGTPNVYTYGEVAQDYTGVPDLGTIPSAGTGYLVLLYADNDYAAAGIQGDWPKTLSVGGTHNTSTVGIAAQNTDGDSNGLSGDEGWNLIGNPFGTNISVTAVISALEAAFGNGEVNSSVYIWDPDANSGNGAFVTRSTGNAIAAFQAFFVRLLTPGDSGNFNLDNDARTSSTASFLKEPERNFPQLILAVNGEEISDQIRFHFTETGNLSIDRDDVFELSSLSSNYLQFFSLVGDQALAMNNLPNHFEEEIRIPIHLKSTESGTFRLESTFESVPEQWQIKLQNTKTGETINLRETTEFHFDYTSNVQKKEIVKPVLSMNKTEYNHLFNLLISPSESSINKEVPESFTLEQNYPNPFNPVTVIRYQLPVNSEVRLEVFDMSGRQVATLVNTQQNAGTHTVNFDGSQLSSGVYMYRLEASGISLTKKLTLIK